MEVEGYTDTPSGLLNKLDAYMLRPCWSGFGSIVILLLFSPT